MTATNVTTWSSHGQPATATTDAAQMPTRPDTAEQAGRSGAPLFVDVFAQTSLTPAALALLDGVDKPVGTAVDGVDAEPGADDAEASMLATWLSSQAHHPSLSSPAVTDEVEHAAAESSSLLPGAAAVLSLLTPMQAGGASALPPGLASASEQAVGFPGASMESPLLAPQQAGGASIPAMGLAPASEPVPAASGASAVLPPLPPMQAGGASVPTTKTAEADLSLGDAAIGSTTSVDGARLIQAAASVHGSEPGATLALHPRQPDLWQRPLVQALGERLQIQGTQGEQQAVIRLDPPSLGRVEIVLRQDGAGWQVQLSATHPEVARQLHVISDTLRQELSGRQPATVSVQVASDHLADGSGRQQRHAQDGREQPTPGRAWNAEGPGENEQAFDFA